MSPPLAGTEKKKYAKTNVRRRKSMTPAALAANKANSRLSRGPVTQAGKERTRVNACTHKLRAELPILPGENSEELHRRLEVWPALLGAKGEIEVSVATQAVHTFWRVERANLSEDAAAERVMIAIDRELEQRDAEQVRLLEAQLDSAEDPQGVVRKLQQSPAGCRLLLQEFRGLHDRMIKYHTVFWSQRTRLFHVLGRREGDLFTDDPLITQWMVALLGTVVGDDVDKLAKVTETLDPLRPVWMGDLEYAERIQLFVAALPGRARGKALVLNLIAAATADLKDRLNLAEANARHERELAFRAARVDDSAAGARRLSYKMRHDGSFHAALRRLDAMKKMRWAGLTADGEETGATEDAATESSPAVETMAESTVTNDPITAVTNEPIVAETTVPIPVATTIFVPSSIAEDAERPGQHSHGGPWERVDPESETSTPEPEASSPIVPDTEVDWCARARGMPRSDQEVSWRAFLRPALPRPPEAGAGD